MHLSEASAVMPIPRSAPRSILHRHRKAHERRPWRCPSARNRHVKACAARQRRRHAELTAPPLRTSTRTTNHRSAIGHDSAARQYSSAAPASRLHCAAASRPRRPRPNRHRAQLGLVCERPKAQPSRRRCGTQACELSVPKDFCHRRELRSHQLDSSGTILNPLCINLALMTFTSRCEFAAKARTARASSEQDTPRIISAKTSVSLNS